MFAKNSVIPFAHDLFKEFYLKEAKGNLFVSPSSIYSALSLLLPGAVNETREALITALRLERGGSIEDISKCLGENLQAVTKGDEKQTLVQANGVFINKGSDIKQAYCHIMEKFFKALSQELNFVGDPEGARVSINKWISDCTKEKIKNLLPEDSITNMTRFVLVNALYFKGSWKSKFAKCQTDHNGIFHTLSNGDVKVSMMCQKSRFAMANFADIDAKALKIPFECHEMLVVLPEKDDGFADFVKTLSEKPDIFMEVLTSHDYYETEVILKMPMFCLGGNSMELKEPLQKMGLKTIFDAASADFSGMTDEKPLSVSDVYHQAVIEVDEEGAEAAAATACAVMCLSMPMPPPEFTVDRPFVFFITTKTGVPVFMGRVVKPEAKKSM